jgi:hypothetical protein
MQVRFNCLRSGHFTPKCPNKSRCMHCHRMHHSLLHLAVSEIADVQVTRTDALRASDVLRATAWVNPHTAEGSCVKVRTLLDQGSTLGFISGSLCRILRATRQYADFQIRRFGKNYTGHAKSKVVFGLTPYSQSKPLFPVTMYDCKNLVLYAASVVRPPEWWPHLRDLPLEDPKPASGQPIHLLIGADSCGSLVLSDLCRGLLVALTAKRAELDWHVSGPVYIDLCTVRLMCPMAFPNAPPIRCCGSLGRMRRFPPKSQGLLYITIVLAHGDCHINILTGLGQLRGRIALVDC